MKIEIQPAADWGAALSVPARSELDVIMSPAPAVEPPPVKKPVKPETPEKTPEKEPVEPATDPDPGTRPAKCPDDSPCPMPD